MEAPPTYDMSIHHNPDAQAWSRFYCETFPGADEALMTGWFANAMMAMHDWQAQKHEAAHAETAALQAEVERLREDAERWRAFFASERFYVMGAAGFDWDKADVREPRDETNWLHFTLNIWDRHPAHGDEKDVQGRAMLLSYVDYIRRQVIKDRSHDGR